VHTHTHRAFISKRERARAGKKRRLLPGPFSTGAAWLLWLGAAAAQWGCVLAGKSIDTQLQKRRLAAGRASHVPAARRSGRRPACKTRPPHTFAHTLRRSASKRAPRAQSPRALLIRASQFSRFIVFIAQSKFLSSGGVENLYNYWHLAGEMGKNIRHYICWAQICCSLIMAHAFT
jgi:hypothetical protein